MELRTVIDTIKSAFGLPVKRATISPSVVPVAPGVSPSAGEQFLRSLAGSPGGGIEIHRSRTLTRTVVHEDGRTYAQESITETETTRSPY